ncbi:hypothetical protein [Falsiroseomonas sp. HW251]
MAEPRGGARGSGGTGTERHGENVMNNIIYLVGLVVVVLAVLAFFGLR